MPDASNAAGLDYGWRSAEPPHTSDYLWPPVRDILRGLGARRVLDLGAGNGALAARLHGAGFDVVGIDPDTAGMRIAAAAHAGPRFHCLGVSDAPQRLLEQEAPFDAVVSTEVIEHLYAPHELPAFAQAVLRPGGSLIVTTPYHGYLKNLALALAGRWDHHHTALWQGGHIKFWSRATLTRLLQDAGLQVVGFRGAGRLPFLWKSMVLVARRPGGAGGSATAVPTPAPTLTPTPTPMSRLVVEQGQP